MSNERDFDFLFGSWSVRHRRLRSRGADCADWDEFAGTAETRPLLDGTCNIEEHIIGRSDVSGIALRAFDHSTSLWSIYWASERSGRLEEPVVGSFSGNVSSFFGEDIDEGRGVQVKFLWDRSGPGAPIWEQSFSYDQGATWELNWRMEFARRP
jgi:hypothetical protein